MKGKKSIYECPSCGEMKKGDPNKWINCASAKHAGITFKMTEVNVGVVTK